MTSADGIAALPDAAKNTPAAHAAEHAAVRRALDLIAVGATLAESHYQFYWPQYRLHVLVLRVNDAYWTATAYRLRMLHADADDARLEAAARHAVEHCERPSLEVPPLDFAGSTDRTVYMGLHLNQPQRFRGSKRSATSLDALVSWVREHCATVVAAAAAGSK